MTSENEEMKANNKEGWASHTNEARVIKGL
jgi:hypothetical protein